MTTEGLREKFLKIYANIPLNLRKEIIAVVSKSPITWNVAYIEIYNKTKMSKEILEKLGRMNII